MGAGGGCKDIFFSHLSFLFSYSLSLGVGWSGYAMVLGKPPGPGRPTIWITVGKGILRLQLVRVGLFGHFTLFYLFSLVSPSLSETARYRMKYCLKGPLNPKQPTNQLISLGDGPM